MRVLWCGDSPSVSTGFARCTRAVCDELVRVGHEVAVLGINHWGDPYPINPKDLWAPPRPPYPIFPCYQPLAGSRDVFGVPRLRPLVEAMRPDVVVLLNDPWNVPAYTSALEGLEDAPPIVGWLAVDAENQKPGLDGLARIITWTDWARRELIRTGYAGPTSVVPLGVDSETFTPGDRLEWRRILNLPRRVRDGYIIGVVGRNQERKRLDLAIRYFARWIKTYGHTDAFLYLLIAPTGEGACDVRALIEYEGIKGHCILDEGRLGQGLAEADLPLLYRSFDLYATTSQGEGWGLPALEAMACGLPVLAPDWSGLGDWSRGVARLVPCSNTALSAPIGAAPYTIGGVADPEVYVEALEELYLDADLRRRMGEEGRRLASKLTWERTAREMVGELERYAPEAEEAEVV